MGISRALQAGVSKEFPRPSGQSQRAFLAPFNASFQEKREGLGKDTSPSPPADHPIVSPRPGSPESDRAESAVISGSATASSAESSRRPPYLCVSMAGSCELTLSAEAGGRCVSGIPIRGARAKQAIRVAWYGRPPQGCLAGSSFLGGSSSFRIGALGEEEACIALVLGVAGNHALAADRLHVFVHRPAV